MSRLLRAILPTLATIFLCANAHGQIIINGVYYSGGNAREVKGTVVDSLSSDPIIGAVVSLITEGWGDDGKISVKNYSTNGKGEFTIKESLGKQARLEISFLGYKMKTVRLDPRASGNILLGRIRMAEDTQEVDKLVVRARMEMYRVKGDTTLFFPKSVNTLKGDSAVEILRQMPGVSVLESGEIVIGQDTVKRAYVNDRLIFGEDARTALKYLGAEQVSLIQAYDEEDEESAIELGKENAKKRKVINLLTFDKFDTSLNGSVNAGLGADFRRDMDGGRQLRYSGSVESNIFNERYQIQFSAAARNMNNSIGGGDFYSMSGGGFMSVSSGGGSGYNALENASLTVTAKSKDLKHTYAGSYAFRHSLSRSASISLRDYFSTADYDSRVLADTTSNSSRSHSHTVSASYNYKDTEKNTTGSLSTSLSLSGNGSDSEGSSYVELDGEPLNHILNARENSSNSLNTSVRGNFQKRFGKHSLYANGSFNHSDGRSDAAYIEDDVVSGQRSYVTSDGDSGSLSAFARASYNYTTEGKGAFGVSYSMNYRNSRSNVLAFDTVKNEMDSVRTRTQTVNNLSNSLSANYNITKNDKHTFRASLAYDNTRMMRDDRFPKDETLERTFHSVAPTLYYYYKNEGFNIGSGVFYNVNAPSLEMFSDRLDVSNPLWLRGGNPELRQSGNLYTYLSMGYMTESQKVWSASLSVNRTDNDIVTSQRFFTEETHLPEYNYTAAKGSTLSTYRNAGHYYHAGISAGLSLPVKFIKSNLTMRGGYSYSNPEEGVEDRIVRSENHSGNLLVSLQSNFSANVRLNLSSNTTYTHFRNYENTVDRYISERLSADLRWDLFQRISITVVYAYNFSRNSTNPDNAMRGHTLNASIQCRVFKDRMGVISINAFDILNNNRVYSSSVTADYINTMWRQAYSSYITLGFEYKFSRTR